MYTRRANIWRTCLDILAMLLGLVLLAVFLTQVQTSTSLKRQQSNSHTKLIIAQERLLKNAIEAQSDLTTYDAFNQAKADVIRWYLDRSEAGTTLAQLKTQFELEGLMLVDADGGILGSAGFRPDLAADSGALKSLLDGGDSVTQNGRRWYASTLENGSKVLLGADFTAEDDKLDDLRSDTRALKDMRVGTSGYVASLRDGRFTYHPIARFIGKTPEEAGLGSVELVDGFKGWVSGENTRSFCEAQQMGEVLLVAVVPQSELSNRTQLVVTLSLCIFALVVSILIAYSVILRRDIRLKGMDIQHEYKQLGKKLYFNRTLAGKVLPVAGIALVMIFLVTFYMQTLSALSRQSEVSVSKLDAVERVLTENEERVAELRAEYDAEYTRRAQNIAWLLAQDPSIVNDDDLSQLATHAQISAIYVMSRGGRTVATNTVYKDFVLSDDPTAQSYPFWDVARGYVPTLVQEALPDDTSEQLMQYVGVKRVDAPGMVQLGMLPKRLNDRLKTTGLDYLLRNTAVEDSGLLFATDKTAEHLFLSYPVKEYIGRAATDYGLRESAFKDGAAGFQTVDTKSCFVVCEEYGDAMLYVAIPNTAIYQSRMPMTLLTTLGGLVILLLLSAMLILSTSTQERLAAKPSAGADGLIPEPKGSIHVTDDDGKTRTTTSAVMRWSGDSIPWNERSSEQKLMRLLYIGFCVVALALTVLSLDQDGVLARSSVLSYIMNMRWEKTVNVFSLTYIGMLVMRVWVVSLVLRKLILAISERFGARSETVGRLMDSFLKYITILGALFYSLNFIGIDSATLLTSAGLLTLIVGLGSKSLIEDILAGIFIVIEGEFRVGDIVTIGDWRGTVMEIGIRTTKIDSGGNIKIFSNSTISGVVNMTRQYSFASCDVGVEYGESLERVENILSDELPGFGKRLPAIQSGPFYKGVVSLGDSAVVLRIVAQCKEGDRAQLCSDLNREVKLLFDRYDIGIPFPQVVVNQPAEHEKATHAERRAAAEFVTEQKELSRDMSGDGE